jgi:hypothetical protein
MTSTGECRATGTSDPLLRWVFQRDAKTITCEVDVLGPRSYDVSLVPHWDVSASIVQHFDAPQGALLRHADIARQLREGGWTIVDRGSAGRLVAA